MEDEDKTKGQLINELAGLRQRIAELETSKTERKQAEEALRESEEQLRLVTDALPVLISYVDSKQYYRFNNEAYEEWFGHPRSEVTGKHVKEVLGEPVYQVTQKYFEAALSGQKVTYEGTMLYKDGGTRYVIANYVPHFGEGGEVKGFFVVVRDITDRKQAEESLRDSKEFAEGLIASMQDGLSVLDSKGVHIDVNNAFCGMTGFSREELIGVGPPHPYWPPEEYEAIERTFQRTLRGEFDNFELNFMRKNGERFPAIISPSWLRDKQGSVVSYFATVKDITDRKQTEETLRESEEKFRMIFESVNDEIIYLDKYGKIIDVNERVEDIFGYKREELIGKNIVKIGFLGLKDLPKMVKLLGGVARGNVIPLMEVEVKHKDGSAVLVEASTRLVKKEGKTEGFVVIVRDITDRKQAEEREEQLQQELNLASRLASIGELAAGVAHEINNPLTGIMGFSQRLLRKSTDEKARQGLERIHNESVRAAKVVENLLTFARHREPKKRYLNMNDILQKALELRAYELKTSNIEVVTNFSSRLSRTRVDFHQMQEVFVNIILNAEQAMTESNRGGELNIRTQKLKDNIRISFTDDGPGIPPEHLDKIFDPFFTTRGRRGGTGLGLSVCHGIVERHGGRIYARSKAGKGTTFFVELPLTRVKR